MKITIDLANTGYCETETQIRKGACNHCGKCCFMDDGSPCVHVYVDSYKDDAHTIPMYSCNHQFKKPISCVLHPLPFDVKDGCGFYWENK